MKRIAIVGCPGSGKTTLARKLNKKTNLPVIHLDYFFHQLEYDYYNNRDAWIERVERLIQKPTWIMDGNDASTFEQRFAKADTIIFIDYPRWRSLLNVLKRRWRYRNKLREEMPPDWKEKADWNFLKYVWGFNNDSRVRLYLLLKELQAKNIVILKTPREVKQYLNRQ